MAGSFPRSFVWILAGVLALATFAALFLAAGAWTQSVAYTVSLSADSTTSWAVSFPRPEMPLSVQTSETVERIESAATPHGGMYNVSGRGNATLWFTSSVAYFDLGSVSSVNAIALIFNETSGSPAWVARSSSDPSRVIAFAATSSDVLSRADERAVCPGLSFLADLAEGWNALTMDLGTCVHTFPLPSLGLVSVPFLVAGLACTYVGVSRGLKFRWAK